jgi:hypothetical protein
MAARRLRLVIGQPGALVGFDEHVLVARHVGHQKVDAGDLDTDGLGGDDGHPAQFWVHLGRHVVDGAALMEVGGPANPQPLTFGQQVVEGPTGLGDLIDRDARLTAGGSGSPPHQAPGRRPAEDTNTASLSDRWALRNDVRDG